MSSHTTTSPSSCDEQQTVATIRAMLRQEELGYSSSTDDYLSRLPDENTGDDAVVDAACRSAMARWFHQIADWCRYSSETVEIALSCLDRYSSTPAGREDILLDRSRYQLAAMTALYTTVKIHEQEVMTPSLVSRLSRGAHSAEDVEAMESRMLTAIRWRVNPPTAASFARSILDLVELPGDHPADRETLLGFVGCQIETVVGEYGFCTVRASSIAYACVLNAIDSFLVDDGALAADLGTAIGKAIRIEGGDDASSSIVELRTRIYDLLNGTGDDDTDGVPITTTTTKNNSFTEKSSSSVGADSKPADRTDIDSSPRTVATSVAQR